MKERVREGWPAGASHRRVHTIAVSPPNLTEEINCQQDSERTAIAPTVVPIKAHPRGINVKVSKGESLPRRIKA
jgi:hypothetical protein